MFPISTPNPFVGEASFFYWSATEGGAVSAWGVGLGLGDVSNVNELLSLYVWPVRGGQ